MKQRTLHSEEYFGKQRSFWWNDDYIKLLGDRFNLQVVTTALDVGCGLGHWGRTILPLLSNAATLVGVDREETWVRKAQAIADSCSTHSRKLLYQVALAQKLPFRDDFFDLVTCQTLLIHVNDPQTVIKEMIRVLKPGGKILLIEPNNQVSAMVRDSIKFLIPIDSHLKLIKLQMICEKGKADLGLGYNSLGDVIPKFCYELGLTNIKVYQSDRAFFTIPPYNLVDQQAMIEQKKAWASRDFWIWDKQETQQYFLAGGGSEIEFPLLWNEVEVVNSKLISSIDNQDYYTAGGAINYVVYGEKHIIGDSQSSFSNID